MEPGTPEWNMAMFESLIELRDLGIGSGEFFAAEVQIIDIDNFTVQKVCQNNYWMLAPIIRQDNF